MSDPQAIDGDQPTRRRDTRTRRLVRWLAGIAAALVILLALAIGSLRVLLAHVPDYRDQIRAWVNDTTRLDVRFRDLDARWRVFGPEIYITAVEVHAPHGGPLLAEARAASIGFDLWRALLRAELLAGRLELIEPEIGLVRTADGRIELEGQAALDPQTGDRRFTAGDMPTGRLDIVNARVTFTDLKGEWRNVILSAVDLTVRRDRDDLEIDGEIDLPERMGSTLDIDGRAHGALREPGQLAWEIELRARDIELAGWRDQFGTVAAWPLAGRGDIRLDAALDGEALRSGKLSLQLSQVLLPATSASPAPTRYPVMAGDFELQREKSGWRLAANDLALTTERQAWPASVLFARWDSDARGLVRLDLQANFLRLENLVPLVGLASAGEWRQEVVAFSPEGEVRALTLGYVRRDTNHHDVRLGAGFSGLGFSAVGESPGVRGLTGAVSGSSASGGITIDSSNVLFTMPKKFRTPLSADVVRGDVGWTRDESGWHLKARQFKVRNAHANTQTDIDLTIPSDDASPVLNLHSRFRDIDLVEGWRYLPIDKLGDKTLAWLDHAFLAGRAPSGEFVFKGPAVNFPFRDGTGEFRVSFPVEGLTLHYADDWPRLEKGALDVEFRNQGLTAKVKSGTLHGLEVGEGVAQFVDFRGANLTIKARAKGDLGAALGYLQQSPVGEKLGATFTRLRGSGPVATDVDLLLPVKDLAARRVLVAAQFEGARVALEGEEHVIEQLAGTLRVDDERISSPELTGTYLGGPIRIELTPSSPEGDTFENVVRVRASTPGAALVESLGAPDAVELDGRLDWRASARIPVTADADTGQASKPVPTVRFDSTLRGVAVGLPAPLAKGAEESRALHVEVQWPKAEEALVAATYGSSVRTQLRFARAASGWAFDRGTVRLGAGDARLPAIPGLELRGTVDELDLSEWLALRSGKPGKRPLSDYLRSADFTAHDLRLFGFDFTELRGTLLAGERAWSVSVDGPQARGTILVPYDMQGPEPLIINMSRLRLDTKEGEDQGKGEGQDGGRDPDPTSWPDVNVSVGDFSVWGKRFGFLRAEIRRASDGIHVNSVTAQAASFTLRGSGAWTAPPHGQQQGALKLELETSDVLQTMKDLGYGESITGKRGTVAANLTWPGPPDEQLLGRLSGTVSIQIDDGQLLTVQPGAGRIFGLMSVSALPRRLSLDFTDFTNKGLAFDSVGGDFTLTEGDAYTENLLLKGPAAEIGIIGRTGLERRDYDQTAVVTGSIGQSLPLAGALAGGPVVGAALLVFSQIFKKPLKGIGRGYYRITGSWENPVVQRVDGSDKKKAQNEVRTAERNQDEKP